MDTVNPDSFGFHMLQDPSRSLERGRRASRVVRTPQLQHEYPFGTTDTVLDVLDETKATPSSELKPRAPSLSPGGARMPRRLDMQVPAVWGEAAFRIRDGHDRQVVLPKGIGRRAGSTPPAPLSMWSARGISVVGLAGGHGGERAHADERRYFGLPVGSTRSRSQPVPIPGGARSRSVGCRNVRVGDSTLS
jgi:hypothetical protein